MGKSCPLYDVRVKPFADDSGFDVNAYDGERRAGYMTVATEEGSLKVVQSYVMGADRRCGLGTKLYTAAAKYGCNKYSTIFTDPGLESDEARSGYAQAFWEKQVRKGRARCTKSVAISEESKFPMDMIVLRRGGCRTFKLTCPVTDLSGRRKRKAR